MKWVEGECTVNGIRLHYMRAGHGSPVLLLHGVTDNGRCWGHTRTALAGAHDVVSLDQRGHGRSEAPTSGYGLADLAADAAGAIEALANVPVAVVGHSLGARVALTLAATRPELVARVVLEDPPLNERAATWTDQARYDWLAWLREYKALSREELIARCREQSPRWDDADCVVWAESKLEASPRLWETGGVSIVSDWRAELRAVRCPLLLVRGDTELGSIVDDAHAEEAMSLVAAGRDLRIGESGHSIHRDQAIQFADAVVAFLA